MTTTAEIKASAHDVAALPSFVRELQLPKGLSIEEAQALFSAIATAQDILELAAEYNIWVQYRDGRYYGRRL